MKANIQGIDQKIEDTIKKIANEMQQEVSKKYFKAVYEHRMREIKQFIDNNRKDKK